MRLLIVAGKILFVALSVSRSSSTAGQSRSLQPQAAEALAYFLS